MSIDIKDQKGIIWLLNGRRVNIVLRICRH